MFARVCRISVLMVNVVFMFASLTAIAAERDTVVLMGKKRDLIIESDLRVVAKNSASKDATSATPKEFRDLFAEMGFDVVPANKLQKSEASVGIPVWFDKNKKVSAILTNEIVVRSDEKSISEKIKKFPNVIDVRESKVKVGFYFVKLDTPQRALAASRQFSALAEIKYSHPNFKMKKVWRSKSAMGPSDEPYFAAQWHLKNTGQLGGTAGADIHAQQAWEVTLGSEDVVIAVLDAGFEMSHPDLAGAWFINHGEIPGNGIDDDNNGYIDDVNGWNYRLGNGNLGEGWNNEHGTAVAGLAGARINGAGMTGTCPRCTLLPVSLSWDVAEDAEAFYYAHKFGAHIATNSWGYAVGMPETDAVVEAINEVAAEGRDGKGMIILFAMNNLNVDDCIGEFPDISSLDSVIAVSASSDQDKKVSNSAWGACMEFLSPSYESGRKGIASTNLLGTKGYNNGMRPGDFPDLDYTNDFGGTSAATPIAAGVFGLMLSVNENLTRDEALAMVLATADKVHPDLALYDPTGFSTRYGFGRINAAKALRAVEVFRKYSRKDKGKPQVLRQ